MNYKIPDIKERNIRFSKIKEAMHNNDIYALIWVIRYPIVVNKLAIFNIATPHCKSFHTLDIVYRNNTTQTRRKNSN